MSSIPVVDFASCSILNPSQEAIKKMGNILVDIFSTTGFVYLKNHGIDAAIVDQVYKVSKQFFELPVESKRQYSNGQGIYGYVGLQEEQVNKISTSSYKYPGYKEMFNVSGRFLENPDLNWPDKVCPLFSSTVKSFMEQGKQLALQMLKVLAAGLNLEDKDAFTKMHSLIHKDGNYTALRTLHYPPLPDETSGIDTRLAEHSDYDTITLLFQDTVGDLKVQTASGEYIEAAPIEGTVLVNIGDSLQFMTGGKLKSTRHKVDLPTDPIKSKTARQSVAYFVHANDNVAINQRLAFVGGKKVIEDDNWKPITMADYLVQKLNATYDIPFKL